jgi:transposase-like protein
MNSIKDSTSADGIIFRCNNSRCRSKRSIRDQTFFAQSKLSISNILLIIYFWCHDFTQKQVEHELQISKKTLIDWYRFCRDIVCYHFENEAISNDKIGGEGQIIEIDESVFSKRKYCRGRLVKETWVFGGVNRNNKEELFIEIVPDRSKETLLEVIKRRIKLGSTIMSDKWKSYDCLSSEGFVHYSVNHSENFVDPENRNTHTQNIESRWNIIKKHLKRKGTNVSKYLDEYLLEYCFKRKFRDNIFDQFLIEITKKYRF